MKKLLLILKYQRFGDISICFPEIDEEIVKIQKL